MEVIIKMNANEALAGIKSMEALFKDVHATEASDEVQTPPAEKQQKRTTKTKPEKQEIAEPQPEETKQPDPAPVQEETKPVNKVEEAVKKDLEEFASEPENAVDPEEVFKAMKTLLTEKSRAGKADAIRSLIQSYGVTRMSDIPKDKHQEVIDKAEAL